MKSLFLISALIIPMQISFGAENANKGELSMAPQINNAPQLVQTKANVNATNVQQVIPQNFANLQQTLVNKDAIIDKLEEDLFDAVNKLTASNNEFADMAEKLRNSERLCASFNSKIAALKESTIRQASRADTAEWKLETAAREGELWLAKNKEVKDNNNNKKMTEVLSQLQDSKNRVAELGNKLRNANRENLQNTQRLENRIAELQNQLNDTEERNIQHTRRIAELEDMHDGEQYNSIYITSLKNVVEELKEENRILRGGDINPNYGYNNNNGNNVNNNNNGNYGYNNNNGNNQYPGNNSRNNFNQNRGENNNNRNNLDYNNNGGDQYSNNNGNNQNSNFYGKDK